MIQSSMEISRGSCVHPELPESDSSHNSRRLNLEGYVNRGFGFPALKKRGHGHGSRSGNRSWIKINQDGNSTILELDKATIMRHCSLPARDLRLLDPLFIYPSTILGREKAIVVSLEQIRCIITADEVILMNSLNGSVIQYESEFRKRLQSNKDRAEDLPFEFRALELALELTCMSLDAQNYMSEDLEIPFVSNLANPLNDYELKVKELELEIYPVLDELASSINTLNLERVRRLKGQLLALTQHVQKVHDEIEHLMDDDSDMAEMYLTDKKQRSEANVLGNLDFQNNIMGDAGVVSKSAPASPVRTISGGKKLQRAFSSIIGSSSLTSSSNNYENIDQLEMLLEAYFVVTDHTLSKLLSLKEYIDDTEDLINIKLGNIQNQLIQFQLLLTTATFVATIFAAVTAVFGMNFEDSIFNQSSTFNWVLIISGLIGVLLYFSFLFYFRHKKVFPL